MKRLLQGCKLPEDEIEERFIRSSGPGGQNVNKVSSAVQLRFDVVASQSLNAETKRRLITLAGRRVGADGMLVITARNHREQALNRAEARKRLGELIQKAGIRPKKRKKTRPTKASRQRRLESKKRQSHKKQLRRSDLNE